MKSVELSLALSFDLIIKTSETITEVSILDYVKANPEKPLEYRCYPYLYQKMISLFSKHGYKIHSNILEEKDINKEYAERFNVKLTLRDYQKEALDILKKQNFQGVIVLPTAAGKTIIGLKAIELLKVKTLIIVPVINLMDQWIERIARYTRLTRTMIGKYGDTDKSIKDVTVTTYASARQNVNVLRQQFGFLIFDECHHAAANKTLQIAEGFPAYYRLGLTATPERTDQGEEKLFDLIGTPIYVAKLSDLSKKGYVADYELKSIQVPLNDEERQQYKEYMKIYRGYLRKHKIKIRGPQDFKRYLIFRVNQDPEAKAALGAHRKARNLVFSSASKLEVVLELLERHKEDQVVIFSEFNDMVYEISTKYLIPAITHETKNRERLDILEKFSDGTYSKIVTGKVLDEGWDVQSVSIGIVVSGTSQSRQFIQRLGRLLRPKQGKSLLYELITPKSLETRTVRRRRDTEVV